MYTLEDIATDIQNGNTEKMEQLWEMCYNFIRKQARKWAGAWANRPHFDMDDLMQSGYLALYDAVQGYQKERGSFLGFLVFYLKTEFSNVVGCRTQAQRKEPLNNAISLDSPAYSDDEGETTVADTIPYNEPGFEMVEEASQREYVARMVREAISCLPERQRYCLDQHYLKGKTYAEIAKTLRVANSYPGQLVKNGLRGLRNGKYAPTLSELLWCGRNLYKHTGFTAWKNSGCSVQEWNMLWQEKEIKMHHLKDNRASKIRYCVDVYGMDRTQAENLFPV